MRIEVSDAVLGFGPRTVLDHVTAKFHDHRLTALIGPSGSGKSTLLAAMAGYQKLESGTIEIVGSDDIAMEPDPSLIAWIPQFSATLLHRTALENVMIGSLAGGSDRNRASDSARAHLAQVGLEEVADQPAATLSGGELQRMAFARAIATERPILFADEPTSSLDKKNSMMLGEILRSLDRSATIVIATHDSLLADAADDVVDLRS